MTRAILKEDIPNLISYLLLVPGNYFKFDEIIFLLHLMMSGSQVTIF